MQIICARLLQTLCCLFFFVTPAIYSIEFEDYDSWYKIDWQNRRFILTIEAPVAPEHVGRAKGIYLTEQQIERHKQETFQQKYPLFADRFTHDHRVASSGAARSQEYQAWERIDHAVGNGTQSAVYTYTRFHSGDDRVRL